MPAAHKEAGDYRAGLRSRRRLAQVLQTRDQGILLQEGDRQGEQECGEAVEDRPLPLGEHPGWAQGFGAVRGRDQADQT